MVCAVSAAMFGRHAASDVCRYGHDCTEDEKDGRGCCPAPTAASGCPSGMVHVAGGTFAMGSPTGVGSGDEHPQHRVTLAGYCIDKTEVTVAAYARCAASGTCTAASEPAKDGVNSLCNGARADRQDHPINCVDWDQAAAYCASVDKRLPSEAEWELAARGDDGRTYPWGNEAPSAKRLNACGGECRELGKRLGRTWSVLYEDSDGWDGTAPVGSFPAGASPAGALDMAGNVCEWTADWYGAYTRDASKDPHGPKAGSARAYRGGGWFDNGVGVRGAFRSRYEAAHRNAGLGFRCARGVIKAVKE
jgi:formylglycine-generating enzyme required for sulfatase activity